MGRRESERIGGLIDSRISRAEPVQAQGELTIGREFGFEESPSVFEAVGQAKSDFDGMADMTREGTIKKS